MSAASPLPASDSPLGGVLAHYGPVLGDIADRSIAVGLETGSAPPVPPQDYAPALQENGASFVTLKLEGELRGCVGTVVPYRPLVIDVCENSFNAAFRDPRFAPLARDDLDRLSIGLTLLDPLEPLSPRNEVHLLTALVPGRHGLVLEAAARRAVFLPAVWAQLPAPADFLSHLKRKAELDADAWSPSFKFWRFTTESTELA